MPRLLFVKFCHDFGIDKRLNACVKPIPTPFTSSPLHPIPSPPHPPSSLLHPFMCADSLLFCCSVLICFGLSPAHICFARSCTARHGMARHGTAPHHQRSDRSSLHPGHRLVLHHSASLPDPVVRFVPTRASEFGRRHQLSAHSAAAHQSARLFGRVFEAAHRRRRCCC
jgi:hypothetical protein